MKVIFRCDASIRIGTGHVMRCLTLADVLRSEGDDITFICRELPGNLCSVIKKKGHKVSRLSCGNDFKKNDYKSQDEKICGLSWKSDSEETVAELIRAGNPDWIIVDHYFLDKRWEAQIRPFVKNIMVIDDLADRPHDCDVLLDQNFYEKMEMRYEGKVPKHCRKLLGPGYALLRPEFREARRNLKERDGGVRRMLVFFSGSDPTNETARALEAIYRINRQDIGVDVVVGNVNPHRKMIKQMCSEIPSAVFHCQVDNMAKLMAQADLAIGAGGITTWERCFLGLPSIVLVLAKNQYETTVAAARVGALRALGWAQEVSVDGLCEAIEWALKSPKELRKMAKKAMELMGSQYCDGIGSVIRLLRRLAIPGA
ncbi:MAG: UDP-2,4-diacetamido-2,4,6-trideoxy-beta-L-altropyranose hydrolase [Peptococcaceae bacterium]|nr:UDP-2,4-diacetamido-2,4,6-trideoxy-beta-L-altropyranose hydrolase [Peptococcaceae bacterium]